MYLSIRLHGATSVKSIVLKICVPMPYIFGVFIEIQLTLAFRNKIIYPRFCIFFFCFLLCECSRQNLLRMWGRKDQAAGSFNEHSCAVIFSFRHMLQWLTLFLALIYSGCNELILKWAFERDSTTVDMNFIVHLILSLFTVGVLFMLTSGNGKI